MRKFIFSLTSLLYCTLILYAEQIKVDLDCSWAKGPVVAMVFDSPEGFRGLKGPLSEEVVLCEEGIRLIGLPQDDFALVVYFDQNNNGRLDRNFLGIPSEPIGFSGGYKPKGPPQYAKAVITSHDLEQAPLVIDVSPGLGPRGRFGVGALMLYRSSVYVGEDSQEFKFLPGLSYVGKRIQILGPNLTVGLWNVEQVRTAIVGSYRAGAYDENDSSALQGMGDREDTFMAGLSAEVDLADRVTFSGKIQADVLNRIGGGTAEVNISYGLSFMKLNMSPYVGLSWLSSGIAEHDYGSESYDPGSVVSPKIGLSMMKSWGENWVGLLQVSAERLSDSIYDSPIVDERVRASGFLSVSYQF